MAESSPPTVGIIGAGTMGAGIAQVAATSGWVVELMDVDEPTVRAAIDGIGRRLDRLVEKGRLAPEKRDDAAGRLRVAGSPLCFSACDLLLEAVVEDLEAKAAVLRANIGQLPADCVIATNTSSLSISRLGDAIGQARRTVGMHFFNPAPVMKLVEVIGGEQTEPSVVDRVAQIAKGWGKQVARAADVPGFIVNHVARPYYLEAFRILEDGVAGAEQIDDALRDLGGFRMGPLELTDLIGQDVNTATTRSVWEQLGRPPLLHPSRLQERLVAEGRLGRKTGRGVYDYEGETPSPAVDVKRKPLALGDPLRDAVDAFVARATEARGGEVPHYVFARVLVAVIAQAAVAHERGVAEPADIDRALKYGTNYPRGPFEWAQAIGHDLCRRLLEELDAASADGRFAVEALGVGGTRPTRRPAPTEEPPSE